MGILQTHLQGQDSKQTSTIDPYWQFTYCQRVLTRTSRPFMQNSRKIRWIKIFISCSSITWRYQTSSNSGSWRSSRILWWFWLWRYIRRWRRDGQPWFRARWCQRKYSPSNHAAGHQRAGSRIWAWWIMKNIGIWILNFNLIHEFY